MYLRPLWILIASFALTGLASATEDTTKDIEAEYKAPDVFDCNSFSWIENCEALNKQVEEEPNAPLRVIDPTGLEFNFQPGTPSVMMRHLLAPSRESARAVIAFEKAHYDRAELAAEFVKEEIAVMGGEMAQILALSDAATVRADIYTDRTPDKELDPAEFGIFFFYDSTCPHCLRMVPVLADLLQRHKGLKISLLQINKDDEFKKKIETVLNIPAHYLPADKREHYLARMKGTPTIWIQTTIDNKTIVLNGFKTLEQLESAIQGALK